MNAKHIVMPGKTINICPKCKSQNIIFDEIHAEAYCNECGLVVIDRSKPKFINIVERKRVKAQPTTMDKLTGIQNFIVFGCSCYYDLMTPTWEWSEVLDDLEQ